MKDAKKENTEVIQKRTIGNRFFDSLTRKLGMGKYSYEEKQKRATFIFLNIFMIIAAFFIMLVLIVFFFFGFPVWTIFIQVIILQVCLIILLSLFLIFKHFGIYMFFFNVLFLGIVLGIHFLSLNHAGIGGGSPVFIMIIVALGPTIENSFPLMIFWIIITVICLISCFIFDFFFINIQTTTTEMLEKYRIVILYSMLFINTFTSVVLFVYLSAKITKHKNIIDQIGNSILTLNLDSPNISRLMEKSNDYCVKTELLLKGIITNLRKYKNFLPYHIQFEGSNQEEKILTGEDFQKERTSDNFTSSSSSNKSDNKKKDKEMKVKERNIEFGLRTREDVVLMVIKFRIGNNDTNNATEFEKKLIKIIDLCSEISHKQRGNIMEIKKNQITFSFNLSLRCVNPKKQSINCAYKIQKSLDPILEEFNIFVIGLDSVVCGNVKSKNHSNFLCISEELKTLKEMKKIGLINKNEIIIDHHIANDNKYTYLAKQVGLLVGWGDEESVEIYLVEESIADEDHPNEWIYMISNSLQGGAGITNIEEYIRKKYQSAWKLFAEKNFIDALSSIDSYLKTKPKDENAKLLKVRIEKEIKIINESTN